MLFDENTLMGVSLWLSLPLEWAWRLDAEVVAVVVATAAFSLLFCPRPLNSSLFNEYLQSVKISQNEFNSIATFCFLVISDLTLS